MTWLILKLFVLSEIYGCYGFFPQICEILMNFDLVKTDNNDVIKDRSEMTFCSVFILMLLTNNCELCVCLCCRVSFIFGIITCLAGFSGVAIGLLAANRLRPLTPRADPLVCAFGLIAGAPFLVLSLILSRYHSVTTWVSLCFLLYLCYAST